MQNTGYLLINLGTPDAADVPSVRRYLNEFLMDKYVIAAPWLVRRLLVSLVILPFRPRKSAEAYASIWRPEGSPLLTNSLAMTGALEERMGAPVELGMRYGQPSIADAVAKLKSRQVEEIVVLPLYPQFADSTITTSVHRASSEIGQTPHRIVPPFYKHPAFIEAQTHLIRNALPANWDHLLLSFHGLPEQHLRNADPTGAHCLSTAECCQVESPAHATCYRHQAITSSQAITAALDIPDSRYSISFQSRLGRIPWLRPYTDEVLADLPRQGVKHLVVACPAFVADNLETLEEINMQGRETFLEAGGTEFTLIPCLNADAKWVAALATILAPYTEAAKDRTSS